MSSKGERGSFTIEASLSLTIFMCAFVAIVSLANIVKVESVTQYAVNQVAKEISQYYYLAEKAGLSVPQSDEGVKEIDEMVQAIVDFSDKSTNIASNYTDTTAVTMQNVLENYSTISDDVTEITAAAENIYNSFGPILDDPKGVVSSLASMMFQQIGHEIITKVIAQPLCKTLIPKYITSNGDADATLEKMGVVDGLEGLDFRMSSFLSDGRTINVVLVYQIKVSGFGIVDETLVIKQTASTAAWVTGTSLKDSKNAVSNWEKNDFERGKDFVAELKSDNPSQAVQGGLGIDLYDVGSNTFKSVNSVNVFKASYSDYNKVSADEKSVDNYAIKKAKVKSVVKGYANDLLDDIREIDQMITMEDGTMQMTAKEEVKHRSAELIIVVPEEAKRNSGNLTILNEIATEIEAETGVKVSLTYRDKALGE